MIVVYWCYEGTAYTVVTMDRAPQDVRHDACVWIVPGTWQED